MRAHSRRCEVASRRAAAVRVTDDKARPDLRARWPEIRRVFEAALDLPTDQRGAFVADQCADADLQAAVRVMLEHDAGFPLAPENAAAPSERLPLARVDIWRLVRLLGQGGMGTVYLAERDDGLYQQKVAIKFLRAAFASASLRERFDRERRLLARLRHPQLAELLDGGITDDGTPYLVMAHIEGESLLAHAERCRLGLRERLMLLRALALPVAHAHRHLIVHRDIKPGNILVVADGLPVLLDFGIAKALDDSEGQPLTAAEALMTPAYAAPEQLQGREITAATDVYQLGLVALELLTGRPNSELRNSERQLTSMQPSRLLNPDAELGYGAGALRGEIDWVVAHALEDNPAARYRDGEAFGDDLQALLDGTVVHARPVGPLYRARKWMRRNRLSAAMIGLAALAIVAGAGGAGWMAVKAAREAQSARAAQAFLQSVFTSATPERNGGNMPTALDLADSAFERLDRDLDDQPLARADLYRGLAGMYNYAGDSRRSLQSAERALALLLEYAPNSARIPAVRIARGYGLVYADRIEDAQAEMRLFCHDRAASEYVRVQCTLFDYGLARTLGDPDRALDVLLQAGPLFLLGPDPYRHAARHARVLRHDATALRFLTLAAQRARKDPMGRAEAAFLLSTALPLLAAAGGGELALAQSSRVAAEQPVIWLGGDHVSDFAVDRVRMHQLLGSHAEALAAARAIKRVDPARRLDVEPLLTRAFVELNDGDRRLAGEFFEAVRAALEGRTGTVDPRLWLARAGLACLRELDGDASGIEAQHALLDAVVSPDFEEYRSLARSPCPALAESAAARRPPAEAPPALATLQAMLARDVLPNLGRCPDGHVVAPGARCAAAAVPANLR